MAASTTDRYDQRGALVQFIDFPVAAATITLLGVNQALNAGGYLVQLSDTGNLTYVGLSRQHVDNSGGGNGTLLCSVEPLTFLEYMVFDCVSPAASLVGALVYAVDDHTVAAVGGVSNSVLVGKCKAILTTGTAGKVLVSLMERTVG